MNIGYALIFSGLVSFYIGWNQRNKNQNPAQNVVQNNDDDQYIYWDQFFSQQDTIVEKIKNVKENIKAGKTIFYFAKTGESPEWDNWEFLNNDNNFVGGREETVLSLPKSVILVINVAANAEKDFTDMLASYGVGVEKIYRLNEDEIIDIFNSWV